MQLCMLQVSHGTASCCQAYYLRCRVSPFSEKQKTSYNATQSRTENGKVHRRATLLTDYAAKSALLIGLLPLLLGRDWDAHSLKHDQTCQEDVRDVLVE